MGSCERFEDADWVMVGLPYDGTCSYRPGARFGPAAIREASYGLETYSPRLDRDLGDVAFFDAGDLELPFGGKSVALDRIRQAATQTLAAGKRWMGVGGEHLVTLPVIEAYLERFEDLAVLHFDAHADLRDDYLGETLSHASVMRRIADRIGPQRLIQVGIRSGPREEFNWMREHQTLVTAADELPSALQRLQNRPVFLTVDLDVLDPGAFPGTGTPEPGGMSFQTLIDWLERFQSLRVVGADAVELAPTLDPTGVSSVVAAKVIRETLLIF
ncbi:MAG: agmatinase [Vampirovibrionales bacterium]|nr:agmatinase [Vampirovibrionales bacterium]